MFHKIPLGSVISLESICVTTGMKSCDNTIVELFWLKLLIVTFEILNDKPKVESRDETILFLCVLSDSICNGSLMKSISKKKNLQRKSFSDTSSASNHSNGKFQLFWRHSF